MDVQWYEVKLYPQQFPVADDPFTDTIATSSLIAAG